MKQYLPVEVNIFSVEDRDVLTLSLFDQLIGEENEKMKWGQSRYE